MFNWDASRCRREKQRQVDVQKSLLHLQSFFLLIRTIDIFCGSRCRPRLALHDCICLFE